MAYTANVTMCHDKYSSSEIESGDLVPNLMKGKD
jgi:hypothetical protein